MKITRQDDRGGAVLNWAVRYALGRYSYAPSLTDHRRHPSDAAGLLGQDGGGLCPGRGRVAGTHGARDRLL